MKIRVVEAYEWTPPLKRQLTYARTPSAEVLTVKRDEGEWAIAAGKAERVEDIQPEPRNAEGAN